MKLFTVSQGGLIVAGLEFVSADNANILRLIPDAPLSRLAVGEATAARWKAHNAKKAELYKITCVKDEP